MKNTVALAAAIVASAVSMNAFAGGDIAAGKAAAEKYNCAACHGKDFNSPVDPKWSPSWEVCSTSSPLGAGLIADYLAHALVAYQRGGDGANGRANAIMGSQAKPLSRDDIKNIAAYLHSLPGALVLRK